jgi:hypothetical protein
VMDFEVLTIFHPTDDVINSVVLLQKPKAWLVPITKEVEFLLCSFYLSVFLCTM